jgi:hypothetical protein
MRLREDQARERLAAEVHGVLCTLHPTRGPDPQPVVYAITDDGYLGVPIDKVKPKSSSRLKREDNLEADHRGTLLIEHWETQDWSRLWWVRAELRHEPQPSDDVVTRLSERLADTVPQYADRPFHRVLVCRVVGLTGWAASEP